MRITFVRLLTGVKKAVYMHGYGDTSLQTVFSAYPVSLLSNLTTRQTPSPPQDRVYSQRILRLLALLLALNLFSTERKLSPSCYLNKRKISCLNPFVENLEELIYIVRFLWFLFNGTGILHVMISTEFDV